MNYPKQPLRAKELEAVMLLSLFFLVWGVITHRQNFFYGAIVLLASVLLVPRLARTIARAWLNCARRIGTFNTIVILSIVYCLFLTPLAFLYRLFTRDPLMLNRENWAASFYSERNHTYVKTDLDKMW